MAKFNSFHIIHTFCFCVLVSLRLIMGFKMEN